MKNHFLPSVSLWLLFACLFSVYTIQAQQKWANYTYDLLIGDLAFEGDDIWVPTQGGLVQINRASGAKQIYLPSNSGLKGASVIDVLVDTAGIKWIGAETGGLLRFDGSNWTQYAQINTGDTLIYVQELTKDALGRLWFTSRVNGNCNGCNKLIYLENGQFHKVPNPPGNYFSFITADNMGQIWAGTESSLTRVTNDMAFSTYYKEDIGLQPGEDILGMGFDRVRNTLYVTAASYTGFNDVYSLHRFDGTNWKTVSLPAGVLSGYGRVFQNDPAGNFWIQVDNYNTYKSALLRFDGSAWTSYSTADLGVPGDYFNGMNFDPTGHLWTAAYENGQNNLMEQQPTGWKTYDTGIFPIGTNYFDHAAFDKNGHAWLMGGGLLEFDGLQWTRHVPADFGANTPLGFTCVATDTANATLWAGLSGSDYKSAVMKYDGTAATVFPLPDHYTLGEIIPLPDGKIWTYSEQGLGYFDGSQWTWYDETNSPMPYHYIFDIALDAAGNIWASVYLNTILRFDGTNWSVFNGAGVEGWLFCDRSGVMWTGGPGGLRRYNGAGWTTVPVPGSLANQAAWRLVQDFDLSYWVAANGGLYHWDGAANWEYFSLYNAPLTSTFMDDLQIDPFGNKWLVGGIGLTLYNENGISSQFVHSQSSLQGKVYFDSDQDGQQAASGEPGIPNAQVRLLPDSVLALSVSEGLYTFFPAAGPHRIEYLPAPDYTLTSDSAQYHVVAVPTNQTGFDFGAWTADLPDSLELDLTVGVLRCFAQDACWLHLTNHGFINASGQISFVHDPALQFESSVPPPTSINGNTLTWDYTDLPFTATYAIKLQFSALNEEQIGDTLLLSATATQNGSPAVASDELQAIVRCGYDPNDKVVEPVGPAQGEFSLLENPLEYTIHFQNTGNDTAFTIVIRDTLDPAFDASSLEIVSSSHAVRAQLEPGGVLTFIFTDINLLWQKTDELGSQGYVRYRIKARSNLPDAVPVHNTAHIYFDFNPAIVTNTTSNVLVKQLLSATGGPGAAVQPALLVSPNPMGDETRIGLLHPSERFSDYQLQVFDLQGHIMRNMRAATPDFRLKKENMPAGIYLFRMLGDGRVLGSGKVICGE